MIRMKLRKGSVGENLFGDTYCSESDDGPRAGASVGLLLPTKTSKTFSDLL